MDVSVFLCPSHILLPACLELSTTYRIFAPEGLFVIPITLYRSNVCFVDVIRHAHTSNMIIFNGRLHTSAMISRLTIIGMVAGGIIIALAASSLAVDLTEGPLELNESFMSGETTSYQIDGEEGAVHTITVTAERFTMGLRSPGGQTVMPVTEYRDAHTVTWAHEQAGRTHIELHNTGKDTMHVSGSLSVPLDPIIFAYHLVVITAGVVIIGFSMALSLRKPRGF